MSDNKQTIRDWSAYLKAIFYREQKAQGVENPVRARYGDRLTLRGKTYEFQPRKMLDGWKTFTPRVEADSPLRDGRIHIVAGNKPIEGSEAPATVSEQAELPF